MTAFAMEHGEQKSDLPAKKSQRDYLSRKGALVWCLGKSRDNWKSKYSEVKSLLDVSQRKLKYALGVKDSAAVELAAVREELVAEKAKTASLATQLAENQKKRIASSS